MRRFIHFKTVFHALVAVIYLGLLTATAGHAAKHDADTPVERGCILCKFADGSAGIVPTGPEIYLPDNSAPELEVLPVAALSSLTITHRAIRAPPRFS